jgi:hypothetical protein
MGVAATAIAVESLGDAASRGTAAPPDLFESCEATFNIDIGPHEAQGAHTVGDLYDLIRWKCQSEWLGASACGVADTYLALKDYVMRRGLARCAKPTSALEVIFRGNIRTEWALLRARFGTRIPGLTLSEGEVCAMSMVLALGLAVGVFGGLYVGDHTHHFGVGFAAGLGIILFAFGAVLLYGALFAATLPTGLKTLADLARVAARSKAPQWSLRPRPRKPVEMWEALSDIVRREAGLNGAVTPDLSVPDMARGHGAPGA